VTKESVEAGKKLYSGMGFEIATEMRLKFKSTANLQTS